MPPERPAEAERPAVTPETAETREWTAFRAELSGFERSLGARAPLPDNPTDLQLDALAEGTRRQVVFTSFHELNRGNEIVYRRAAIQHAADLEAPARRNRFNRESYIVSSQAALYCESLSEVTQFIANSMRNYERCQDVIATLPAPVRTTLEGKRRQSGLVMRALRTSCDERVAFANARQVIALIAEEQAGANRGPEVARLTVMRDAALAQLSAESRTAINSGNVATMRTRANVLERDIIEIAAGRKRIEGVDEGYLPTYLYLDVLQARYTQIQEQEKALILRRGHMEEGGPRALEILNIERRSVMSQMIAYTNDCVGYQLHMARLTSMQNLFGSRINVEGALQSAGPTNAETRRDINRAAMAMRDFHLDRVTAVTTRANVEFAGAEGGMEAIRDRIIRRAITAANVSSWFARILTLGGFVDVGNRVQNFVAGPICEALGWPKNADGTFKVDLTPAEAEAIATRLGRLQEHVQNFNRTNNGNEIRDTVAAIKLLNPADAVSDTRIGQVKEPLPEGVVTAAQVPAKLVELQRTYGNREDAVATLHAILLKQLGVQWGALNADGRSGTGFIGKYAAMLTEIERMIDVQLDVAGACFQMSKNMSELMMYAFTTAGFVGLAPIVLGAGAGTLILGAGRRVISGTIRAAQWMRRAPPAPPVEGAARATPFQRATWVGATAYEAYRLYNGYQDIQREHEHLNDAKGAIAAQLVLAGFTKVADQDVYTHPCGSRIRLSELNMGLDAQRHAAYMRTGVSALGLGAMLMAPRLMMGPAGWVLIGVQITVEAGITAWENQQARRLIANPNTPPWLLIALGTQRLVNRSEYDMLVNSSSWNFIFTSNEAEKQAVRDKMYFTIFGHELGAASPALLREITAGTRNIEQIDAIFSGDFKTLLLPYLYVRLFQKAKSRNSGATWASVKEGRVDRGWVVIPPDITNLDIREAMREIGVLYVQHLREKRFIDLLARRTRQEADAAAAPADVEKRRLLADTNHMILLMGEEKVLGQPLKTLTADQIRANGDKTRAQKIMETIFAQVDGNPGAANFRLNAAAVAGISGLPADVARDGLDLSTNDTMLRLGADDPAQLVNLRRIAPLTTDEPAGRVFPAWNDWGGNARRLLDLPRGVDEAAVVHGARTAANNVGRDAGIGEVAGDASFDAARDHISNACIRLFQGNGRRFTRDDRLALDLYGRDGHVPMVFTNLDARFEGNVRRQRSLMTNARMPDGGDRAFDLRNVRAVFIESKTLTSGHDAVLFTFVYGDIQATGARETRVYVLQRGAATSATGRSDNQVTGRTIAYNEGGFREQAGAAVILNQTARGIQDDDLRIQRALHDARVAEERERPIREAREAAERLRAAREATERAERRRLAMERVRANPNTFVSVENEDGRGSRFVMRFQDAGQDKIVSIAPYSRFDGAGVGALPSGQMLDPEHSASILVDGAEVRIPWNFMNNNAVSWSQARLFLRVLTTPHPGETNMPFERVMSMIPHYDRLRYDVRTNLRDLYTRAADKQGFLFYLIMLAGHRGGFTGDTVINPLIGDNDNVIVRLFRNNMNMFDTAGRAGDMDRLSRGLPLMEGAANEYGIWWKRRDPNATPIGYRFVFGQGWQWTPHESGTRTWMNVDTETVTAGRWRGQSPTRANLEFIRGLPR